MPVFPNCSNQAINSFCSVIVESVFRDCIAYDVVPQDNIGFGLEVPPSQKKSKIENWGDTIGIEAQSFRKEGYSGKFFSLISRG